MPSYKRVEGVRLRPVPELGTCLAFVPTPPRLHTLNPGAWLIAELCDRHAGDTLFAAFEARSPWTGDEAARQLASGIAELLASGIIREIESDARQR